MKRGIVKRVARCAVLVCAVPLLSIFVYNSGFGYDALELLIPARHIAEGHELYSLATAKPFAPYLALAALHAFGMPFNHATVTTLVVAQILLVVGAVWWYARSFVNRPTADLAAVLVFASALFMELNFLVLEGLVAAAGLLAAGMLGRYADGGSGWRAFAAGAVIGVAFHFKQPVAFYAVGSAMWLLWVVRPWPRAAKAIAQYSFGGLLTTSVPVIVLWLTGQFQEYVLWTFVVPLTEFPASTEYFDRLYTKLAWFTLLCLVTGVVAAVWSRARRGVTTNRHLMHLLIGGLIAFYPVTKSQAPHYVFPAAAFVILPLAAFWVRAFAGVSLGRVLAAGVGLALVLVLSVAVYRPAAVARFIRLEDFSAEAAVHARLQELVPPDHRVLVLTDHPLPVYFHSFRYPNVPAFHFDVQAQSYFRRHPDALHRAVEDESLAVVLFDPDSPPAFRLDQLPFAERKRFWAEFAFVLQQRFTLSPDPVLGPHVWVPRVVGP